MTIETIAVDRRGTWSVGIDVAEIFSGATGVLEKSVALIGRQEHEPPREMVRLLARLAPNLGADSVCSLRLRTETQSVIAGAARGARPPAAERKSVDLLLKESEEKLVEVYSSGATQARLAMKIRCVAATAAEASQESEARFVEFVLSAARSDDEGEFKILKTNGLRAAVGHEASDLFSFNLPLPEGRTGGKRYRREKLEAVLSPALISGDRAQIGWRLRGEIATVSATDATIVHPVDRGETLVLAAGETRTLELEVAATDPGEGWTRVRYQITVTCRF
ncbi:MAG TPA: hypothetical protein VFT43_11180 [Candidatus Polarisedimenticolia bacterium]|nr:hypothetical protein [Candidatus Polarisedimenticolia bacterium]